MIDIVHCMLIYGLLLPLARYADWHRSQSNIMLWTTWEQHCSSGGTTMALPAGSWVRFLESEEPYDSPIGHGYYVLAPEGSHFNFPSRIPHDTRYSSNQHVW